MDDFDLIIHQPARLQIMAALCQLRGSAQVDFGFLKETLNLTDGNLGAHLTTLEEKQYVKVEKTFVGKKPKTFVSATAKGKDAFARHVAALQAILKAK